MLDLGNGSTSDALLVVMMQVGEGVGAVVERVSKHTKETNCWKKEPAESFEAGGTK